MRLALRATLLITGAALLNGCGRVTTSSSNGGTPTPPPPATTITGQVIKGYVQGASVFIDTNGNGVPDSGETVVQTDSQGRYTLPAGQVGSIIAIGGVDTVTNVPLDGNVFRAPAGSTVVTPFTTLVTQLTESGVSAQDAESRVRATFGVTLPAGSTLLNFDSVGSASGAAVEDKSEAVMNTISAVRSILAGAGVTNASERAVQAVTELARGSAQSVSLNDAAVVTAVLQQALVVSHLDTTPPADVARVAQAITSVNSQLLATSGTSDEAIAATRYAQSHLQDLMTQVGATGQGGALDLTRLENDAAQTITQIIEAPADVITQAQGTSIAAEQRVEGHAFAFALRPAVVRVNGQAATVQSVAVHFDIDGLELKRISGAESIAPSADGTYRLTYDELDKIQVVPPAHFNGRIPLSVTITYSGVGARPAEALEINVAAVNDAPVAAPGFAATLGSALSGSIATLLAPAFNDALDDQQRSGGSVADTFAGIAVVANAATGAQGTWQYSTDNGATWTAIPNVSASAALLIAASSRVRFQPAPAFSGSVPGTLSAYLVDSSGGLVTSGATVNVADSLRGGASRYSASAVSLAAGAVVNLTAPATSGTGSMINAATLASGVPITVALANANASVGDRIELRLNGDAFEPALTKVLTTSDITRGSVTFTIPANGFGTDGHKSVSVVLTYADSGVAVTSNALVLVLDTTAPAAPGVTLEPASDTGVSASDRITSASSLILKVTVPGALAGDVVRLRSGASTVVEGSLTVANIQAGFVTIRVDSLSDGAHGFAAQMIDSAGNPSAVSSQLDVTVDTVAPAALTLDAPANPDTFEANDARTLVVIGNGAEPRSTVELTLIKIPSAPVVSRVLPNTNGRFATLLNASAAGAGIVTVSARAVDVAGNASETVDAQITVTPAIPPNVIDGLGQTDEIVSGTPAPDLFVVGPNSGQDYFIGGSAFDTVRVNGSRGQYVVAVVPDSQRSVHQKLLGTTPILQAGMPLVRLAGRGVSAGDIVYLQAEAIEFSDTTVRITPTEIVGANGN